MSVQLEKSFNCQVWFVSIGKKGPILYSLVLFSPVSVQLEKSFNCQVWFVSIGKRVQKTSEEEEEEKERAKK